MRQRLGLILAVTVVGGVTGACDSGGGKSAVDAGGDAALDSSLPLPSGAYVENAGDACESDTDCIGSMAVCQTELMIPAGPGGSIPFPDGYCTATCTATTPDQCATGSECGLKKLIETLQPLLAVAGMGAQLDFLDMVPAQCLDLCTSHGDCREGYSCMNLAEATGQSSMIPAQGQFVLGLLAKYCLPGEPPVSNPPMDASMSEPDASTPEPDASTPDASTMPEASTPDAAIEAGASEAGTTDAGPIDAAASDATI